MTARVVDSREVEEGDYGWCIYTDPLTDMKSIACYDDDEYVCICDDDECTLACDENDGEPSGVEGHELVRRLVLYRHPDDIGALDGGYELVDEEDVRPLGFVPAEYTLPTGKEGWIYAIAVVPELTMARIKVGYSARSVSGRLASFRTSSPTAMLLSVWPADRSDEDRVHRSLSGRIGRSEVFECEPAEAIDAINRVLPAPVLE
jgi:hypothetical protein